MFGFKTAARSKEVILRDRMISYKKTFGTPDGKQVLFHLMDKYHLLNTHKGDVFSEGQRSVILDILYHTNVDLKELDAMMRGETDGDEAT